MLQIQCLKILFQALEDIMRQNPDLMKQFANAAINQLDGEKQSAAKFFNNFSPGQQPQYEPPSMSGPRPMPDRPFQDL